MQTAKPAVSRVSKPTAPRDARATSTADQHIGLERLGAEGFASGLREDRSGEGGEGCGGRRGLDELAAGGTAGSLGCWGRLFDFELLSLTPALSRWERGKISQRVRQPSTSDFSSLRNASLPLPPGEGRGEGGSVA